MVKLNNNPYEKYLPVHTWWDVWKPERNEWSFLIITPLINIYKPNTYCSPW